MGVERVLLCPSDGEDWAFLGLGHGLEPQGKNNPHTAVAPVPLKGGACLHLLERKDGTESDALGELCSGRASQRKHAAVLLEPCWPPSDFNLFTVDLTRISALYGCGPHTLKM